MTKNEKAVRLAEQFVKDLAQCLFDNKEQFTEDTCGVCGEVISIQEGGGFWCKKCKKGYRTEDKNYGLL